MDNLAAMVDHKKFLQLLSKEINGGAEKFSFEKLQKHLLEAVTALPDGNFKDILQKESQENSEYLWSLVKPSKKCSEIQFNIFNKDGLEKTLKKISQLQSYKEQIRYLSQLALCYPCNKIFELLLTAQRMESPNQSDLEVLNKVTELYGRLTVGCHNFEVLHRLMEVFLSEIDKINDKLKASSEPQVSWLDFKDIIHRFLLHCHVKRKTREDEIRKDDDVTSTEWTQYRDALAAIIAIYIDVVISIGQINDDVTNHLCNIVYLLLGDSPSHILDAANQIFTLDNNTINIVFPFMRKVLNSTRTCTAKCENYIKYLCLAKKVQHCVQNLEMETSYLKKNVCSLLPPENFLTWLTNVDSSLVKEFQLSGLVEHKITDKILQCEGGEKIEKLLDLASSPDNWNQMIEDLAHDENRMDEDESVAPLFFVDAQGSSELVEQCQENELTNSTSDKMLKKQIRILLEKLEETGSEDEKDDFDITLDDNENEPKLDFAFGDNNVYDDTTPRIGDREMSHLEPNDGREGASEGENEINMISAPKEDETLTQSGKKRKKRKSQASSVVPEETKAKSSKRKLLKKPRS